jgi:hypothetical protein
MENRKNNLPFGKQNYIIMLTGIVFIMLGFIVMSLDSEPFGFGVLGLTLGPIIVVIGFIIEFFAILHTPKSSKTDNR